jgi:hypothetical protein
VGIRHVVLWPWDNDHTNGDTSSPATTGPPVPRKSTVDIPDGAKSVVLPASLRCDLQQVFRCAAFVFYVGDLLKSVLGIA